MSATGRGTNRDPKDFYATPRPAFAPLLDILPREPKFWEPCAGDGRLVEWLRASGRECGGADLDDRPELRPLCLEAGVDYLTDMTQREFVITNPPFSAAFEMCRHARLHSREFMFLLRLSFLESEDRGDWLSANEPGALFVLKKRPSFVMSITCKSTCFETGGGLIPKICKHNWILPVEAERPKRCPQCAGDKLSISTSDNSGYAWYYWGSRFQGIHHI